MTRPGNENTSNKIHQRKHKENQTRPYGLHASFLPLVVPLPEKLKKKKSEYKTYPSSGSVERTHQSRDLEGCTYQSNDPGGYTYQFSDPERCTYQSSDPEGCTHQSSDPEGCPYQFATRFQIFAPPDNDGGRERLPSVFYAATRTWDEERKIVGGRGDEEEGRDVGYRRSDADSRISSVMYECGNGGRRKRTDDGCVRRVKELKRRRRRRRRTGVASAS
ncbi:NBS-LRR type resistance protein [Cucumis melo var. makuwa]|uniref:NBS-LRR type resistance protein n=1 Tax=Cucumis melo var. makuwa TaxID=1194695 RepID=A0A5A7THR0_CUCMM|nr:NBS-LRR type resistance protein [Cucumis melo var. makuwa]